MIKLEQKKQELQLLVQQYNILQQELQQIANQVVKIQGAIEVLEEQEKEKKIEIKKEK